MNALAARLVDEAMALGMPPDVIQSFLDRPC